MRIVLFLMYVFGNTSTLFATTMAENITLKNGYIRMMPPMMSMTAAYVKISNTSDKKVNIVKLDSDLAIFTELHTTIDNGDGTSSMKHIETLSIEPQSSILLEKGGKHIMFMRLNNKLKLDNTHIVVFHFSDKSKKNYKMKIEKK